MKEIPRDSLIQVLRDLNIIVVSLDRIGSAASDMSKTDFQAALTDFILQWDVFRKLARARSVLSAPFSTELGEDVMEELEREFQDLEHWNLNRRVPPSS